MDNCLMTNYLCVLPVDLRYLLLHYVPFEDLSTFSKTPKSLEKLIKIDDEKLWKSIWYTFFSSCHYSDVYLGGVSSFLGQFNEVYKQIRILHDCKMPEDKIKYWGRFANLIMMGCDIYLNKLLSNGVEQSNILILFNNTDSRRELFRNLGMSTNIQLIKNTISQYRLQHDDIYYLLSGLGEHSYHIPEIFETLYYISVNVPDKKLWNHTTQAIKTIFAKHCHTLNTFQRFFTKIDNYTLLYCNNHFKCSVSELCISLIYCKNWYLLKYLAANYKIDDSASNALVNIIQDNNNDVSLKLIGIFNDDRHKINWHAILTEAVSKNHLELVKMACERGADGYTHNSLALVTAIQNNHKEIARYLWQRFPI